MKKAGDFKKWKIAYYVATNEIKKLKTLQLIPALGLVDFKVLDNKTWYGHLGWDTMCYDNYWEARKCLLKNQKR